MKVSDLITKLQELPADDDIRTDHGNGKIRIAQRFPSRMILMDDGSAVVQRKGGHYWELCEAREGED